MIEKRIEKLELSVRPSKKIVVIPAGEEVDEFIQKYLDDGLSEDDLIILRIVYDDGPIDGDMNQTEHRGDNQ